MLALEVVLTRVFSVLMWYHFAFMAISLALLGSGIAGVWLYLTPGFTSSRTNHHLSLLALAFGVAAIVCFWLYLRIPFHLSTVGNTSLTWGDIGWLALIYLTLAVPFLFGGATLALAISHFNEQVGRVYFFDLIGASLGCLASILWLQHVGAAGAILLIGAAGAAASLLFSWSSRLAWRILPAATLLVMGGLVVTNQIDPWLQIRTHDGYDRNNVLLYEKWNTLSRVTVYEDPWWLQPFGWGLSSTYVGPDPGHLMLLIDAKAGTPIQRWDGDFATIDFLRYDLTSLAYYLLPQADSFIIGPGGGRDILTGLLFQANSITGVELNPAIIEAARDKFGEYAGHVYDYPQVQLAIEDARTYLMRHDTQYDLIQASLIDTWAASSAKAFALSENGLYTEEAFRTYYSRLTERGMVSYSRWYYVADPTETLRLVALGLSAWQQVGVANPADHIVVIGNLAQNRSATEGLATMLLKKSPFTAAEVALLQELSNEMAFTVLYAPGLPEKNPVTELITAADLPAAIAAYHLDIRPPTDNRPFFFNFITPGDLLSPEAQPTPLYRASAEASYVLLAVLLISLLFALLFILTPLFVRGRRALNLRRQWSYLLYFGLLGMGFMLVEIPFIQRFTLYLGSPTYALAVVLFTILLSSGLGSLSTQKMPASLLTARLQRILLVLISLLLVYVLLLPGLTEWTQQWTLPLRVIVVVIVLFSVGFLMGQPFPLGIKWASQHSSPILTWLWAVNGTTSVVGSTLATITALAVGFQLVSLVGAASYALAAALVAWRWQQLT
ncbi:MAG: hypothetical protein Fur0021_13810 [Candidatus Promineifilaceae bacterium]